MTVKDLIEVLETYDGGLPIVIVDRLNSEHPFVYDLECEGTIGVNSFIARNFNAISIELGWQIGSPCPETDIE